MVYMSWLQIKPWSLIQNYIRNKLKPIVYDVTYQVQMLWCFSAFEVTHHALAFTIIIIFFGK